MKDITQQIKQAKLASYQLVKLSSEDKKQVLLALANCLKIHEKDIIEANQKDIVVAKKHGYSSAFLDRLIVSKNSFMGMIKQLETVAALPDPLDEIIEQRILKNGINLQKKRFPLGVILMIYESRPNVTIDAIGICLKSGNAVVLKGGSEATYTNKMLMKCVYQTLEQMHIDKAAVTFLENTNHREVELLLKRNDLFDVVIPRGNYALTTAVAKKSRIPILYHSSGGARIYIDASADLKKALEICVNAKTNRTGVCNALDMVLVHASVAQEILPTLDSILEQKGFTIRADKQAKKYMSHAVLANKEDFHTEFLDNILAVKVVKTTEEAINFIKTYTHGHTEMLAAEDKNVIDMFVAEIDAAGLMINCSSRLHDGGEFGMGAEMGIATGKFHARGPVGIRELTTYKWIAYGNGQIKQ